jgi:hypothetical protein
MSARSPAGRHHHDGARTETKITDESELGSDGAGGSEPESEDRAGMQEDRRAPGGRKRARVLTR